MKRKGSKKSARPARLVANPQKARTDAILRESEVRYRRLFEAARDGILILDAYTGSITDVNPFLIKLLNTSRKKIIGKKLWQIGLFKDVERSKSAFKELQKKSYIRYEDLPLKRNDGKHLDVEFVSNIYTTDGVKVIQCNIRDISERKHIEVEKAILESVEGEQRRIGQDLHDGLCQELAGIALLAKALAQKLSAETPKESADASEIAVLTNQSIDKTRDLARGLSPVEIEDGLVSALIKFAGLTGRFYKISCVFVQSPKTSSRHNYSPFLSTHLYRIVQEAVSNAIRHGLAKRVVINLTSQGQYGLLRITDNGNGFKESGNEKPGHGLHNMRYRSRMIDARISISQGRRKGMVVACSFLKRKKGLLKIS